MTQIRMMMSKQCFFAAHCEAYLCISNVSLPYIAKRVCINSVSMPYTVKRSYTYIICISREKINEKFMKF